MLGDEGGGHSALVCAVPDTVTVLWVSPLTTFPTLGYLSSPFYYGKQGDAISSRKIFQRFTEWRGWQFSFLPLTSSSCFQEKERNF